MDKKHAEERNAGVCLNMECQEDDLSPAQIYALEKKENAFIVANNMLQVFMNNGEVLYENDSAMLVYLKNTMASSQNLEIIPDKERFSQLEKNKCNIMKTLDNNVINPEQNVIRVTNQVSNSLSQKEKNCNLITGKKMEVIKNGCQDNHLNSNFSVKDPTIKLGNQSNKPFSLSKPSTSITPLSQSVNYSKVPNNRVVIQNNFSELPLLDKTKSIRTSSKMYPSLLIVARPNLLMKNVTQRMINDEQLQLDEEVKLVLTFSPFQFAEWLLKQGLIKSEQYCSTHRSTDNEARLKLCMLSDKTHLSSGRYVWTSDCCPNKYISIYKSSIFEGAPFAATVLLKLLYHWSCQTDAVNIVQWVNVNNVFLKKFFAALRAVCIAALHEEYKGFKGSLGGNNKMVEVGLLSVGMMSTGSTKNIKVWILGAMETETKRLRLQVIEPIYQTDNNSNQFLNIQKPLSSLVNKDSIILTDLSLNKNMFIDMGYRIVYQTPVRIKNNKNIYCNDNLMDYLKNSIPRMFQSTLTFISKEVMQQFLDELMWREMWGQSPFRAFHSIISHIEKQTKIDAGVPLCSCLSKIEANPFMNWQYSNWKRNVRLLNKKLVEKNTLNKTSENAATLEEKKTINDPETLFAQMTSVMQTSAINDKTMPDLKKLENYYYGQLDGNKHLLDQERKCNLQMRCVLCNKLMNTNISMMKHLISHALCVYKSNIKDNKWCKYCLQEFSSDENLKKHVYEKHIATAQSMLRCLICETYLKFRIKLILHMQCYHNELEMPYECSICKYRSSEHRHVIDHFYDKHNFSEKAQCPLCLKVIALKNNGKKITQNMYFFLNHIKKHTYKKLVKRCNRCVLSFINKGVLEYHQRVYHKSCRAISNVKRHEGFSTVWMPTPSSGPLDDENYETNKIPEKFTDHFKREDLKLNININGETEYLCSECEGYIREDGHFAANFTCRSCTFKTCCEKSMVEHIIKFHDINTSKKNFHIARQIILNKPMRCICGFKSLSGNTLANHIVHCNRKSAYPWIRNTQKDESKSGSDTENLDKCNEMDNNEKEFDEVNQKNGENKDVMIGMKNVGRLPHSYENVMELNTSTPNNISSDNMTTQSTTDLNVPLISCDFQEHMDDVPLAKRLKLIVSD